MIQQPAAPVWLMYHTNNMTYLLIFILTFILTSISMPMLIKLAVKLDYVEKPKPDIERKVHKEPKPYLAAVGLFVIFWLVYYGFTRINNVKTLVMFVSSFLILAIGMIDDYYKIKNKELNVSIKFLVQIGACVAAFFAGFTIVGINNPFNNSFINFPFALQFFVSVLWIFGITTVINFIDGLDGLSGGISCISASTLFVVALAKAQTDSAVMAVILIGLCLGYLKYNKFPAKILMGDAGATFLGFLLGILSLDGAFKQATIISVFVPIIAFGLPIFDNIYVALKRIHDGKLFYMADATQIHFRLLSRGLSQKHTVYFLYLISLCLNLSAIIIFIVS